MNNIYILSKVEMLSQHNCNDNSELRNNLKNFMVINIKDVCLENFVKWHQLIENDLFQEIFKLINV